MKELLAYRASLLQKLLDTVHEFRRECLAVQDPSAPIAEGWSVHQLAAHTRDVDRLVYGTRVRRTAAEEDPEFPNFDGEAYMASQYSASEPLEHILDELVKNVEDLVQMLRGLPDAAWSRLSRHVMLGRGLTLQTWVERDLAHIKEHLETIRDRKEANT